MPAKPGTEAHRRGEIANLGGDAFCRIRSGELEGVAGSDRRALARRLFLGLPRSQQLLLLPQAAELPVEEPWCAAEAASSVPVQMPAKGSQTPIATAWLALENALRHPVLSGDSSFFARLRTTYPSLVIVEGSKCQNFRRLISKCQNFTSGYKTAWVLAIVRFVQQYTSSRLALPTDSATGYDSTTGAENSLAPGGRENLPAILGSSVGNKGPWFKNPRVFLLGTSQIQPVF